MTRSMLSTRADTNCAYHRGVFLLRLVWEMCVQTLIRTRRQLLRCLRRLRAPPSHAHMVRSCARPHLLRALGQCDPLHQDRLRASRHPKRRRTIGVSLRWRALYACRRYRTCRCSHNKTSLASRLTHRMATRYQTLACPNYRAVRLLLYRRFKRFGVRGSIVNAMNTFLCVLMAALVFRQERLTARKVLGCAIGFAGVVIVNLTGGDSGGAVTLTGEGFILIAAVSYAVSSALIHTYSQREDPVALSGYQFISPSHRAKPFGSTRCNRVTAGRAEADLSLGKLREAQFPREVAARRPDRATTPSPCTAAGPAGR